MPFRVSQFKFYGGKGYKKNLFFLNNDDYYFFLSFFHSDAAFTNGNTVHPNPVSFHDKVTNMEALIKSLKAYYEVRKKMGNRLKIVFDRD